jgi:hypothetical protein
MTRQLLRQLSAIESTLRRAARHEVVEFSLAKAAGGWTMHVRFRFMNRAFAVAGQTFLDALAQACVVMTADLDDAGEPNDMYTSGWGEPASRPGGLPGVDR